MGKEAKKKIRKNFRDAVFKRDKYKCVMCGLVSCQTSAEQDLDAHHITNPKEIINQGYVLENGISLCSNCHLKAEEFHSTGTAHTGYSPDDLYKAINSTHDKAVKASEKLNS